MPIELGRLTSSLYVRGDAKGIYRRQMDPVQLIPGDREFSSQRAVAIDRPDRPPIPSGELADMPAAARCL